MDGILNTYRLGHKVGYSTIDNTSWESNNELDTVKSILSVKKYIEEETLIWFYKINSLEKYIVEEYVAGNKDIYSFCDEDMCKILGKDREDLVIKMYGMYSPCTDKDKLYNLLNKTNNILTDELWIQNCKDENIEKNNLHKIFN